VQGVAVMRLRRCGGQAERCGREAEAVAVVGLRRLRCGGEARCLDGRGPTRTGDPLGVSEVLWPTELHARVCGLKASEPRVCGRRLLSALDVG
jgi:hypothetical protein